MASGLTLLSALVLLLPSVLAQLSGSVGPTTPLSEKQGTICNVLDYGGSVGSSVSSVSSLYTVVWCLNMYR